MLLVASAVLHALSTQVDLRDSYDVDTYRLDLVVDPTSQTLRGTGVTVAKATKDLDTFEIDLMAGRPVSKVSWVNDPVSPTGSLTGPVLRFQRNGDHLFIRLPRKVRAGEQLRVAVAYSYKPSGRESGIFFHKTPDGKPWVQTECQGLGAHSWWPCKNDNEHPEDKFAHFFMNVTVPAGLTAVSNGNLSGKESVGVREARELSLKGGTAAWTRFHWRHDYPCENYAICLDVAPYVELKDSFAAPGLAKPVKASYFVLPKDVEKAKLQFQDAPRMLQIYSETFGPWPYVGEKFSLVETDFWGEEHSTAVSYGNTFPKWAHLHDQPDQYDKFNHLFDYILIHECAHEWWGNAVSAKDWGHLWLHEGFATYAEAVYLEKAQGRNAADDWLAEMKTKITPNFCEYRGKGVLPSQAFSNDVYYKGAWILNTLRTYVNDDEAWWKTLKEFNLRFRYKCATTDDFQKVLEEITRRSWQQFVIEWFYSPGSPVLKGSVSLSGTSIAIEVDNPGQPGSYFHVPLDLEWTENGTLQKKRITLDPGPNKLTIPVGANATGIHVVNLKRMLGDFQISVDG